MSYRFSNNSNFTKVIIIIEFLLVAYLLYSLTKNIYNSYQVDKYIETFEQENEKIAEENKKKTDDYLYFTSEEYIDKIAKQNLGLVNPGEEVIVLSPDVLASPDAGDIGQTGTYAKSAETTNFQNWVNFFFRKN